MSEVEMVTVRLDHALVVRLTGELDTWSSASCSEALQIATELLPPLFVVVVDLRAIDFCGAAGAHMLSQFYADCARRRVGVCLVAQPGSAVERVIRLTQLQDTLPLFPNPERAVAHYG